MGMDWKRGSFTVEAALLVPLLLYLMLAIIYINFWLFNQVAAQGLCCQAAWQLHRKETVNEEELEGVEMTLRLENGLEKAVICTEVVKTECSINALYTMAECRIEMNIPLYGVRWVLGIENGYESEHRATVSGIGSMTVFRKLCAVENAEKEKRKTD